MDKKHDFYEFIKLLRGCAALSVLYCHWGHNFYTIDEVCANLAFYPSGVETEKPFFYFIANFFQSLNFDFGMFGVAIFFMISGFLVLNSARENSAFLFLSKKVLRIYPLYAIGLAFSYMVLWLSAQYHMIPFTHNFGTYLSNWSLLRLWFWSPGIDGVSWTLECEMFFYLIFAFLIFISCNKKNALIVISTVGTLLIISTHNLLNDLIVENFQIYKILFIICHGSMYLPIISIGMLFYQLMSRQISKMKAISGIVYLYMLFMLNCYFFYPTKYLLYFVSYGSALIIFVLMYAHREKISKLKMRVIDFVAEISFPLYMIHGAAGYSFLAYLRGVCSNMYVNTLIALIVFVFLAWIMHCFLEVPFADFTKSLLNKRKVYKVDGTKAQ